MNRKYLGKTRLETMLVMLLLIIFGISTYTMVLVTATSYDKTQSESAANDNLRLASSYIESKLRHSQKQSVDIVDDMLGSSQTIIIEEEYEGDVYQTAIYYTQGTLRELYIKKDTPVDDSSGVEIAEIDKFEAEYIKKDVVSVSFEKTSGEDKYTMQTIVKLN